MLPQHARAWIAQRQEAALSADCVQKEYHRSTQKKLTCGAQTGGQTNRIFPLINPFERSLEDRNLHRGPTHKALGTLLGRQETPKQENSKRALPTAQLLSEIASTIFGN